MRVHSETGDVGPAQNDRLIDIGKKDMLGREHLLLESFDRNCADRAIDSSRKSITDEVPKEDGVAILELIGQGHV